MFYLWRLLCLTKLDNAFCVFHLPTCGGRFIHLWRSPHMFVTTAILVCDDRHSLTFRCNGLVIWIIQDYCLTLQALADGQYKNAPPTTFDANNL